MRSYETPFDRAARRERKARFEYRARMAVEWLCVAAACFFALSLGHTVLKAALNFTHQVEEVLK